MGTDRSWKDRGWTWPEVVPLSLGVGVGLGVLTYLGFEDWRASIFFGLIMGLAFFAVIGLVKTARDRDERAVDTRPIEMWLSTNWETAALVALAVIVLLSTAVFAAAGETGLAIAGVILAIPPFVILGMSKARRRGKGGTRVS